jgi:hypothetical protein
MGLCKGGSKPPGQLCIIMTRPGSSYYLCRGDAADTFSSAAPPGSCWEGNAKPHFPWLDNRTQNNPFCKAVVKIKQALVRKRFEECKRAWEM